eukprot:TRINITY_DN1793_c0_g1_i6.p1 TRINITY_DN1793_c0_g1~~TRINITY_DN1793_c0_g1_i6.p1  ORF type:complete len:388 (-),score=37.21 TRINITY_DN1793_c0_g1_i6:702-1865(-)
MRLQELLLACVLIAVSATDTPTNKAASCLTFPLGYQCLTRSEYVWCSPVQGGGNRNFTLSCSQGTTCEYLYSTSFPCVGIPQAPLATSISIGYSCDPSECILPRCKCASNEPPHEPSTVPQLVMLTFDGRITPTTIEPIRQILFEDALINPNGCPIRSTWFAPYNGSNVDAIAEYIGQGQELASRTFNDGTNPEPKDISENRRLLSGLFTNFPEASIQGFRTPDLKFDWMTFGYLQNLSFSYDASIPEQSFSPFSPGPKQKMWPYTLDYGIATNCFIGECNLDYGSSSARQAGLWSIPMYTFDNVDNTSATYGRAETVYGMQGSLAEIEKLWRENFFAHYDGNRAPLGLWLTPAWFIESPERINFLKQFINVTLELGDVYFVSGSDK